MTSTHQQPKFEAPMGLPRRPARNFEKKHEIEKKPLIEADAESLFALAKHYQNAAELLSRPDGKCNAMRFQPYRLNALQAIELCLSAYLRQKGVNPKELRGFNHEFSRRAEEAINKGLSLKKRTILHLGKLSDDDEYLNVRYNPAPKQLSELTRIKATLDELFEKTAKAFN